MTTSPLGEPAMRERIERPPGRARRARAGRPRWRPDGRGTPRERPAAPGDRVVVRRDRHRARRGRPPDPAATSSPSQVALHAPTGGIVPEVAARAHLRWIVPVARRGVAGPASTWRRRRRGRRHLRARGWPARCSSASTSPRRWPGSTTSRSSAVNHLEGHVYAAWLADPGEDEAAEPSRSSRSSRWSCRGGHTFLVEMRDHLTYRLLGHDRRRRRGRGVRQGRAAARARLPGRAGHPAGGRGRDPARHRASRGRGWATRTTSASPGSRRPRGGSSPTPGPTRGSRRRRRDAAARGHDCRARMGLPGLGRRRARHEGDHGRLARSGPVRSCSAAASRRTAACASGSPARRPTSGVPLIVPRPGLCTDNGAMIGAAGARRFEAGERAGLDLDARPSLPLARR